MLHIWDAIEADFLRDYGIVLMERLDSMSWRVFLVLLNNLSPYGSVAARIRAKDEKSEDEKSPNPDKDKRDADSFFSSIVSV